MLSGKICYYGYGVDCWLPVYESLYETKCPLFVYVKTFVHLKQWKEFSVSNNFIQLFLRFEQGIKFVGSESFWQ